MSTTRPNDSSDNLLNTLEDRSSSEKYETINEYEVPVATINQNADHREQDEKCSEENYERITLDKIANIRMEVEDLEKEITYLTIEELREKFQSYEEVLLQKTITLDNIETKCLEKIRKSRKSAILYIQNCLQTIDNRLECE